MESSPKSKLLVIKFGGSPSPAGQPDSGCAKCKDAGSGKGCSCPKESEGKRKRFSLKKPEYKE